MKPEELLEHEDFVRNLARSLVTDQNSAADITQQTWLAALQHPPSSGNFIRAWLSKITRSVAIKLLRGEARRAARERAAAIPEGVPSTDDIVALEESRQKVVEAVLSEDESYRSAILLRFYHDLPVGEIAHRLGIPVETARSRIKRGLTKLRGRLDGQFGDRSKWCLALAPLVGLKMGAKAAVAGAVVSSATVVSGGVIMATKMKVGVALVLICSSAVLLWQALPDSSPGDQSIAVTDSNNTEAESLLVERDGEFSGESATEQERVNLKPNGAIGEAIVVEKRNTVQVDGRFIDTTGRPVEGVQLLSSDSETPVAISGPDGCFDSVVSLNRHPTAGAEVHLFAEKEGFTKKSLGAKATQTSVVHFGNIILSHLRPRASVSGVVLDERGVPVSEGWVGWTDRVIDDEEVNLHRLTGNVDDPMDRRSLNLKRKLNIGSNGIFRLDQVSPGRGRVWATDQKSYYTFSEIIEVEAYEEKSGIRLVLEPVPLKYLVEGIVLDPIGVPVPGARIKVIGWSGKTSCSMSLDRSNSDGKFSYILGSERRHTFEARVGDDEHNVARVDNITEGTPELVIQFTTRKPFYLRVESDEDRKLDEFEVGLQEQDYFSSWIENTYRPADLDEEGLLELAVPRESFLIKVEAEGFETKTVGPYSEDSIPEVVNVTLYSLPCIKGSVTAEGRPVTGAKVALCKAVNENTVQQISGFVCRSYPWRTVTTNSDLEGIFCLWIRESGQYYLRAEAEGFSISELGPLDLKYGVGTEGLELTLTRGGCIEGYVKLPPDRGPAGIIVAASRGDGFPRTTRTDEKGYFCFRHLTAGPWQVEYREKEINLGGGHTARSWHTESAPSIPWSCIVEEGKTTRYDLDMGIGKTCISGRLDIVGEEAESWKAVLTSMQSNPIAETDVTSDGEFTLQVSIPGSYWLTLYKELNGGGQVAVKDIVDVKEGMNPWSFSLSFGHLEIQGLSQPKDGTKLYFRTHGPRFLKAYLKLPSDKEGRVVLNSVPAGQGSIRRIGWSKIQKASVDEVLAEVTVPVGGTATVDLRQN